MTLSGSLRAATLAAFMLGLAHVFACGGGSGRGGGGTGVEVLTTFRGNVVDPGAPGVLPISGVGVCITGADNPEACGNTDDAGLFVVGGEVSGGVSLEFTFADFAATLCLAGVPAEAEVTLVDVACAAADGLCVPGSITVNPAPEAPVTVCNTAPTDGDGDGVPDDRDLCPNTPAGEVVDADGCSVSQLVPCAGPVSGGEWKNHGEYVATVADVSRQFVDAGLLTQDQRSAIVQTAAQSDCGKDDLGPGPTPQPTPNPDPDDSDGDGVPNGADLCPATPAGEVVNADGCSVAQLAPCDGPWKNHGEYVATVADVTRDFVDAGLLTSQDRSRIVGIAARSDCGK